MKFSQLFPEDYPYLEPFFEPQHHELCTYSLATVIAWRNHHYYPVGAVVNDMLVVGAEFPDAPEKRHLMLPIAGGRDLAPRQLAELAVDAGFHRFNFVPGSYLEKFGPSAVMDYFSIQHQPAYDDYIYRVDDLAQLVGNRYSKKRNLIHQFEHQYVDAGRVAVAPIARNAIDECLEFLELWCEQRGCDQQDNDDLSCEKQAAVRSLKYLDVFKSKGLLLRLDGQVCAFGIAGRLTARMGTLSFEKAFGDIKGLYQYFDRECARRLYEGRQYINKESDMGQAGLAKAKKSYRPVKKIKSHRLVLKK